MTTDTSLNFIYLHDALTGSVVGSCGYSDRAVLWDWIAGTVAGQYECRAGDVDLIETDSGDKITARGEVVAYTSR